ncbi:SLBB domain-containing protein [Thiomicrorhabdus sp. 6S2-11]|uniref:SLBB domain-containing protein n=1 Tax=Thiomicrorhabdus marina TaxID=2818442 RepID=A0ABS3Q228_9GAMM|nr:polysaccharide biosynthesis/export family protein [Thiomicrorhabdus marina]MBO1926357.1 SLBB domain-containing protein [Thiomicrorhabdus marina]
MLSIFKYLFVFSVIWIFNPVLAQEVSDDYRLAAGDSVSVNVFGEEELSFESLKLNEKGQFSYPFVGDIEAQGLTAKQLQEKLVNILKDGFLKDPKLTVSVEEYRQIYVSGAVNEPGGYPYQPGLTVRGATTLAGGLTEEADEKRIFIIREKGLAQTETLAGMEVEVGPGDSVNVKEFKKVFITGAVKKPGSFPFEQGLTVAQLTALAGGLTERASESKITVVHDNDESKTAYSIEMKNFIQPGDSVTVGEGFF